MNSQFEDEKKVVAPLIEYYINEKGEYKFEGRLVEDLPFKVFPNEIVIDDPERH